MRIIGGSLGGKQLTAPKSLPVRPTTDFAKEGLFNILNNKFEFENLHVLDLFAGTGNITFEFASRGAAKIQCIDKHTPCVDFIRATVKLLKLNTVTTERADVFKYLIKMNKQYNIIFADPPYELENIDQIHNLVFLNNWLLPEGILIIEHGIKTNFQPFTGFIETRRYGNVNFSFFTNK